MQSLQGKVALVTGASRGIGRAIAQRLAREGAIIVINYGRSSQDADALVSEIKTNGGEALAVQADVAQKSSVSALFAAIDQHFGRLDILVNNAGVAVSAPLEEITEEMIDSVFAVNIKGVIFASQEAVKRLPQGGRIVNISSSTANFPLPTMSIYAASKAAEKIFTEVWSQELAARGITVNSVQPGATSPGMFDEVPQQLHDQAVHSSPFNRIGTADEIAAVVAFLCTDDARWVVGQHILVNGGARI